MAFDSKYQYTLADSSLKQVSATSPCDYSPSVCRPLDRKYDIQSGHTVHGLNIKIEILFLVSGLAGLILKQERDEQYMLS